MLVTLASHFTKATAKAVKKMATKSKKPSTSDRHSTRDGGVGCIRGAERDPSVWHVQMYASDYDIWDDFAEGAEVGPCTAFWLAVGTQGPRGGLVRIGICGRRGWGELRPFSAAPPHPPRMWESTDRASQTTRSNSQ